MSSKRRRFGGTEGEGGAGGASGRSDASGDRLAVPGSPEPGGRLEAPGGRDWRGVLEGRRGSGPGSRERGPRASRQDRGADRGAGFFVARVGSMSGPERRAMVVRDHPALSLSRQCRLLSIGRSSLYYKPKGESAETLALMRRIDELFLKYPFYGARQTVRHLRREGVRIGRRRAGRLMRLMGLQAIYRAPRTSAPHPEHRVWPYLLRGMTIERANQVWCADITYIPVRRGFLYLVAIMDWASRYVLAWQLSNTLDARFCTDALEDALAGHGAPEIFNTDQQPVHQLRLHRAPAGGRHPELDGRQGPVHGQHLHRAAVALAQIRGDLSARDRRRPPGPAPDRRMAPLLQHREAALGARWSHPGRSLPRRGACGYDGQAAPRLAQAQQQQQEERFKGILAA